jgi:hypothetical protein
LGIVRRDAYRALPERCMTSYRLFVLDERKRLVGGHIIEAGNDADALEKAQAMGDGVTHEVWDRDRLVGRTRERGRG